MPELATIPSDSSELPKLASVELTGRAINHTLWWDYYEGRQKKFLKVREGEPDYNTIVNLCARVVDQSVNFMIGTLPTFDLPGDDAQTKANEAVISAWLDSVDFEDFANDLMTMQSVTGHAFVKLMQTGDTVRPVVLDSSLVTAFWDPFDKTVANAYMILWSNADGLQMREDHIKLGNSWEVISYTGKGGSWSETGRFSWPYPFAQIVEWKNLPNPRGYYGKSDLEQITTLNDAYNFRLSNTNKILYIHAHPRTIAFGVDRDQLGKTAVDGLWFVPDSSARLENLEMQSDLESSRANAMDIKGDFFSDSQTVDLSVIKDKAGQLTNFGLRLMFSEALSKNGKKRRLAGGGLAEVVMRAGTLMGLDWTGARVIWGDPLPENKNEQVQNAKEVISMKIASRQTESEALGYDWERESKRIAEETKAGALEIGKILAANLDKANGGLDDDEEEEDPPSPLPSPKGRGK